jgi:hypothetical protein
MQFPHPAQIADNAPRKISIAYTPRLHVLNAKTKTQAGQDADNHLPLVSHAPFAFSDSRYHPQRMITSPASSILCNSV